MEGMTPRVLWVESPETGGEGDKPRATWRDERLQLRIGAKVKARLRAESRALGTDQSQYVVQLLRNAWAKGWRIELMP